MTKKIEGTSSTPSANKVIRAARATVGYREGPGNTTRFAQIAGHFNGFPWCATWVEAITNLAGQPNLIPTNVQAMAGCDQLFMHFKEKGRTSVYPAVGALFFLGSRGGSSIVNGASYDLYHVGLVVGYDDTWIYTVEGNTNDDGSANGDGVYARQRPRRGSTVIAYAYPEYPEGILNADPGKQSWNPKKPVPASVDPHKDYGKMDPRSYGWRKKNASTLWLKKTLVILGYKGISTKTATYGMGTKRAVAAFQRKQGWTGADADGYPGKETLKLLRSARQKAALKAKGVKP